MKFLLDDEALAGPHSAHICVRPARHARPVISESDLFAAIASECQFWGGANTPIVPVDQEGTIPTNYLRIIAGSALEGVRGLHPYELFHVRDRTIKVNLGGGTGNVDNWGRQLAVALLKYQQQSTYRELQVLELSQDDPWKGIYAACLGLLPSIPDPDVLQQSGLKQDLQFEDFLRIDRSQTRGSLDDLLDRLGRRADLNPRQVSMLYLAYGGLGSAGIRSGENPLPDAEFAKADAGANIVVVCSPGDFADLALLWNLRAAHGDTFTVPIGIPFQELSRDLIRSIIQNPHRSFQGFPAHSIYVTSSSVPVSEIKSRLGDFDPREIHVTSEASMLTFGPPAGLWREEVLVWEQGQTTLVPMPNDSHRELFEEGSFTAHTRLQLDVAVQTSPFPNGSLLRVDSTNATFYCGASSASVGRNRAAPIKVAWPSRRLMADAVAANAGLQLTESEPGRAARIALSGISDIWELTNLAHAPLLRMLEEMAARTGFGWYRDRMRAAGADVSPVESVGRTIDELPERSFGHFQRVIGNNTKATKFWLSWAEEAGFIVKGFQLRCSRCHAKQWVPVTAFAPPITCRGCGASMDRPFGDNHVVNFTYRLSERLRRVYEHDAIGHLLALRFFNAIFSRFEGSDLIGQHPGMEVRAIGSPRVIGEADVLLLLRDGLFAPVEVKRSFSGARREEVEKLADLARAIDAPWTMIVACDYGISAPEEFVGYESRHTIDGPDRLILSFDTILDPEPHWALGADPFQWNPMSFEEITGREKRFVERLVQQAEQGPFDWLSTTMLRRPEPPQSANG